MEVDDCVPGSYSQQINIQAGTYTGSSGTGGGSGGTNPCAAYCSNPVTMTAQSFNSGNIGTAAACYQSSFPIGGFSIANTTGRTFLVNGQVFSGSATQTLPPKTNGGYCFQATAGGYSYASFMTW
jgi:hypothetical protein